MFFERSGTSVEDEFLPSGVLEYRWRSQDTIGLVAFSELTYAERGFHGGGGVGSDPDATSTLQHHAI